MNMNYGYEQDIVENKNSAVWDILDEAAANGYVDIVKFASGFATDDEFFPASETSSALSSAISGGHIDVVAYLLGSEYHWDVEDAFKDALKNEQSEIADMIYEDYCQETNGESMFVRLAGNGSTDAVEYLYYKGYDDSDLIGTAFVHAAYHIDTADFMLPTGRVSPVYFDKGFEKAAQIGSMGALENLYSKGRVSTPSLKQGIRKGGTIDVLKFLYQTKTIRSESIIAAFCATSQRCNKGGYSSRTGRNDIMKFLYKYSCISTEMINRAVLIAAKNKDRTTVKLLLDDNRLSSNTMVEAFGTAVANGWQNVMTMLRSKEQISTTVLQNAFARVAKSCYGLHLVRLLYDEQHISDEMVCTAFRKAADCGNSQIIELLFNKPAILREVKQEAFVRAVMHNQIPCCRVHRGRFPLDVFNEALNATSNRKLKQFLRAASTKGM